MQIGQYTLGPPLGVGPAGPRFRATAADGSDWELRQLDRANSDPAVWTDLTRRLRLLALLDYPAVLLPVATDLDHSPPYIVMPTSTAAEKPATDATMAAAAELANALAAAHRLGLTLGRPENQPVRITFDGRFSLDFTDTAGDRTLSNNQIAIDPAPDIARLGAILATLFPTPPFPPTRKAEWDSLLDKMQSPSAADRPLAVDVAAWFRSGDLGETSVSEFSGVVPTDAIGTATEPRVGERLGRFLLLEKVGEGGMGVVFRAEDQADGAIVAVKVLRSGKATAAMRRRFVKEGRVLAALDSPFAIRLVEANEEGNHCFLALEFVAGPTVGDLLRKAGRFDEPTALAYIADAARGLAAAHARGIVHRDIKPDNLMVVGAGEPGARVKVTDFGLARPVVQTESLELTRAGTVLGTPLYMAPEQFGAGPTDPRVDVYGLAATLYHLLAGRPPFAAAGLAALARAVASEEAPPLDRLIPEISAATSALVARCLSKDPADRLADAGLFLRAIEQLRGAGTIDLMAHPRLPIDDGRASENVFTWELAAAPARLWPYVSNTERLNRAAGLPAVEYVLRADPARGPRRFAAAKAAWFRMEWEEHPFEWIEGRRMGVLREFASGPFVWFMSTVELRPRPGGGTTLTHTIRAAPRGLFGRIASKLELGRKAERALGAVYRRIDAALTAVADPLADAFEAPTQLPPARQQRLRAGVERLRAEGADAAAADLLGLYLANAPDQEAARIRPLALARRFGVDPMALTDVCLRAVSIGLLELKWDVICPLCRIPSGRKNTLQELNDHENCPACDADFRADLADAVELVFRAHPDIRPTETGTYCAGGPAHSPHVVAQARVASGERVSLDLDLSEGAYRVRGPQLPWSLDLRVSPGSTARTWEIDLASVIREPIPPLAPGGQVLLLHNGRPHEVIARVERASAQPDTLTAARAAALPTFRSLFPGEKLAAGQLAPASAVTLLLVHIEGGDALLERLGEARAFQLFQTAFQAIEGKIASEGGAVVKTVGDGLVASFAEVTAGARAALGLNAALAADPATAGLSIKAALHRGLALIATVNDRLDYFGHAAKLAARLLTAAPAGTLLVSPETADDPEVAPLLRGRPVRVVEVSRAGSGRDLAYELPL